ncbi:MAG: ABC-ATPase domain-containing protein, partial [Lachnospiraceae bacterium]|nr:ABC-ATPase domain-containing protein [Lachnospiraceae bacterium]
MQNGEDLQRLLRQIDHKGYPSYKQTAGQWQMKGFVLSIDHVQGDPFASPSNVSVIVTGAKAAFPGEYYDAPHRQVALEDYLLRAFERELYSADTGHAGSGKSGMLATSRPGQEVLKRSAMEVNPKSGGITARFEVGFPARGRTVTSESLIHIFFFLLPRIAERVFCYANVDQNRLKKAIELADDRLALRKLLEEKKLQAFVANGSILPRESGVSQRPMKGAVAFASPKSLEITAELPHRGTVTGMGIPEGIFLIIGGGYHGKSTLLSALERGVYDHIAGDGREYVVTKADAMKIRAEDGRSVKRVDVSLFINDLPSGTDTTAFSTADASGSTSQAANVIEAISAGSSVLLIDEDTCATNFMVRDELMRRVVSDREESITPFLLRMRDLYEKNGVSTILVAGSSGSLFGVADVVIQMDEYVPKDVTQQAKKEWEEEFGGNETEPLHKFSAEFAPRCPKEIRDWKRPDARIKTKVFAIDSFSVDKETVDLRGVSQVVDREQTAAIAKLLKLLATQYFDGKCPLEGAVERICGDLDEKGFALVEGRIIRCGLAVPRKEELIAAVNRFRRLDIRY